MTKMFSGLSVGVYVNQSDYLASSLSKRAGIILSVHEPLEFPSPDTNGILMSTGFATTVQITRVRFCA